MKKIQGKRKNQNGFTLVETMIGFGLLGLSAAAALSLMQQTKQGFDQVHFKSQQNKTLDQVVEAIQANPGKYSKNYNPDPMDSSTPSILDQQMNPDQLPFGFGEVGIVPAQQCSKISCDGTFGVLIQPAANYRGLYVVHLRVKLSDASKRRLDFEFLVTDG